MPEEINLGRLVAEVALDHSDLERGAIESSEIIENISAILSDLGVDSRKAEAIIQTIFADTSGAEKYFRKLEVLAGSLDQTREKLRQLNAEDAAARQNWEEMNSAAGQRFEWVSRLAPAIDNVTLRLQKQEAQYDDADAALTSYVKKAVQQYDALIAKQQQAAQKQEQLNAKMADKQAKSDMMATAALAVNSLHNLNSMMPGLTGNLQNIIFNVQALRQAMRAGASTGIYWGSIIVAAADAIISAVSDAFQKHYEEQNRVTEERRKAHEAIYENARQYTEALRELKEEGDTAGANAQGEAATVRIMQDEYDRLRNKIVLTADEKGRLESVAADLAKTLGLSTDQLKDQTGAYRSLTQEVDKYIDSLVRQSKSDYYLNIIKESTAAKERLRKPVEEAKAALEEAEAKREQAAHAYNNNRDFGWNYKFSAELSSAEAAYAAAREEYIALKAEFNSADADYEEAVSGYKEVSDSIADMSTTAEQAQSELSALNTTIEAVADAADQSVDKTFAAVQQAARALTTVQNEVQKNGRISLSTLNDLTAKYPQLNQLVGEYIAGVKTEQDVIKALSVAYKNDLSAYNSALESKKLMENGFVRGVAEQNKELVDKYKEQYGVDLRNFATAAEAKATIQQQLNDKLLKARQAMNELEKFYYTIDNGEMKLTVRDDAAEGGTRRATAGEIARYNQLSEAYRQAQFEAISFRDGNFVSQLAKDVGRYYSYNTVDADSFLSLIDSGKSSSGSSKSGSSSDRQKEQENLRKNEIAALDQLGTAVINAIRNKYEQQKKLEENRITESIENWKRWETSTVDTIQGQISALDKLRTAHDEEAQAEDYAQKRLQLQLQERFEHDSYNRQQIRKQIALLEKNENERLYNLELDKRKQALLEQQEAAKELAAQKQQVLQQQKDKLAEQYQRAVSSTALQEAAKNLILQKSQSDISRLIKEYAADSLSGQKIGESIYNGMSRRTSDVQGYVNGITNSVAQGQSGAASALTVLTSGITDRVRQIDNNSVGVSSAASQIRQAVDRLAKVIDDISMAAVNRKNQLAGAATTAVDTYYRTAPTTQTNADSRTINVYMTANFTGKVDNPLEVSRQLQRVGYEIARQI